MAKTKIRAECVSVTSAEIAGVRLDQARQRIQMCAIGDIQAMPVDRRRPVPAALNRSAPWQAKSARPLTDPSRPATYVRIFAASASRLSRSGPARRVGIDALGQLLLQELLELIASAFVGPKVEVEADDRKRPRIGGRDAVELFGELRDGRHAREFANSMPTAVVRRSPERLPLEQSQSDSQSHSRELPPTAP
jgi:hypothetical protein